MATSTSTAGPEIELKFQLTVESLDALRALAPFKDGGAARATRATYFDTPGHAISKARMALRVREKDGAFIQTFKTDGGAKLFERGEWEWPVADGNVRIDLLISTPAETVLLKDRRLEPMFTVEVTRTTYEWVSGANVVEICLDEGVILAGERQAPILELELELKAGRPSALFDLARQLSRHADLRLSFASKGERGYRLLEDAPAAAFKPASATITATTTAAEAVRRLVKLGLTQVTGNADILRESRAPEAVHQLRVGLRRLRAAMWLFRDLAGDSALPALKSEIGALAGELDAARDLEVLIAAIGEGAETDPSAVALRAALIAAQGAAYDRAQAAVSGPRYNALLLNLAAWVETGAWQRRPPAAARRAPATQTAKAGLGKLRKQILKGGRKLEHMAPEKRHRLRIKVKKARYAAEFFLEAFDAVSKARREAFGAALKGLQDALGDLNDIAMARDVALRALGDQSGEAGLAAGVLLGRREAETPKRLKAALVAFKTFEAAKPFW